MDFFSYLKRIMNEFKALNDESKVPDAEKSLSDYLKSLEQQNDVALTDAQIQKKAEDELSGALKEQTDAVEADAEQKKNKVEQKRGQSAFDYQNKMSELALATEQAKETVNSDSIKKGTARSSIKENRKELIDDYAMQEKSLLTTKQERTDADYAAQIADLEQKRRRAVNELESDYAADLAKRIDALKKERENSAKNSSEQVKYGEELYFYVDSLLAAMSPSDALKFVSDNGKLKSALEPYYYYKLYKKYAG